MECLVFLAWFDMICFVICFFVLIGSGLQPRVVWGEDQSVYGAAASDYFFEDLQ
jgi:hypothetical protein